MTTSKPEKTVESQEPARQDIIKQTKEVLANGGKIVKYGVTQSV